MRKTPRRQGPELLAGVIEAVYNRLELYRDKQLDINPKELAILIRLDRLGARRIGELAETLELPLSTVSWVADRMVREGLLERLPAPDDRRAMEVRLTPNGDEVLARYKRLFLDVAAGLLSYFDETDKDRFLELVAGLGRRMAEGDSGWNSITS